MIDCNESEAKDGGLSIEVEQWRGHKRGFDHHSADLPLGTASSARERAPSSLVRQAVVAQADSPSGHHY